MVLKDGSTFDSQKCGSTMQRKWFERSQGIVSFVQAMMTHLFCFKQNGPRQVVVGDEAEKVVWADGSNLGCHTIG